MRGATKDSHAWEYFRELAPDLALLQEVRSVPVSVLDSYGRHGARATTRSGGLQTFETLILAQGSEVFPFQLETGQDWIDDELRRFQGNLVSCKTAICGRSLTVVSAYSPAWPVAPDRLVGKDVSGIKLTLNPDVWVTELLWAAVRNRPEGERWVIGGDLNSSQTFDLLWSGGPRGNREILDRMGGAGLVEVLRHFQGRLTPTFRNPRGGKVIHQLDHLFVSTELVGQLASCDVGDSHRVFNSGLSDHLPILADFNVSMAK